ncbi:MAG: hypothetical protein Kow0068_21220 [Marinilabiliales bacterium]
MSSLIIKGTDDTPEIVLDLSEKKFKLSGKSLPENAIDFYKPVHEWIENYVKSPLKETSIDFKLEYFNTASAKQIAKMLKTLEQIQPPNKVTIKWYYQKIDTDMYDSGTRYSKLINLDFELIEY